MRLPMRRASFRLSDLSIFTGRVLYVNFVPVLRSVSKISLSLVLYACIFCWRLLKGWSFYLQISRHVFGEDWFLIGLLEYGLKNVHAMKIRSSLVYGVFSRETPYMYGGHRSHISCFASSWALITRIDNSFLCILLLHIGLQTPRNIHRCRAEYGLTPKENERGGFHTTLSVFWQLSRILTDRVISYKKFWENRGKYLWETPQKWECSDIR